MASVDKDVEKLESSHIVARNTKWRNHSGKESRSAPKSYTRVTIWPKDSITRYMAKNIETTHPHKNLHMKVHSSIVHGIQKEETTQMFINWWIEKQKVV